MKQIIAIISVLVFIGGMASAQSVGLKAGTLYYSKGQSLRSQRVEVAFAYPLDKSFVVTAATGYYRIPKFGYTSYNNYLFGPTEVVQVQDYTTHAIPIIAGIKYILPRAVLSPYFSAELGESFIVNYDARRRPEIGSPDTFSRSRIIKWGGGIQSHVNGKLFIDFSGKYNNEGGYSDSIELMLGLGVEL